MGYPPVVVVESGGVPRTQVAEGVSAPAFTVVESGARPITLADNAPPIALFNPDGSPWTAASVLDQVFSPAGQSYAFFDFEDLTSTFQGTDTSVPATATNDSVGRWESRGEGTFTGLQATAGFKPKRQVDGITGDVTDDGLLTDWLAVAGNNCILAKFKVPAVVPGTQIIAGSYNGSSRFWIGYDTTSLRRGVGASSASAPSGDVKGQTIVVGLITTGSNYRVFLNTADIQSGTHTDGPAFAAHFALCCANNAGVLANFSGAGLQKVAFGLVAPTAAELAAIAAEWA